MTVLLFPLLCFGCAGGCERRELLTRPAKVSLEGRYCTSNASQHGVPLRIMAIVDTSKSMEETDPNGGRLRAAAELISSFSPDADVRFSIVTFDDDAIPATIDSAGQGVFTRDPGILSDALNKLTRQDGFTNYLGALNAATNIIQHDIAETAEELRMREEMGQSVDLLRPYYFIIFLSDGIPRLRGGVVITDDEILFSVERLLDVPEPALGAMLHTAFLGAKEGETAVDRLRAVTLLQRMAEEGKGLFHDFESGEQIDFTLFNFEILRRHGLKQFLVYNRHSVLEGELIRADSDADRLSDEYELELGMDPLAEDSDGDGMRDGLEDASGLDPLRPDPQCSSDPETDSDSDGLRDCEERFRGYDPLLFDTDGDAFADRLEQDSGTKAGDGEDTLEDLDFDDRSAGTEIRERTNPGVSETEGQYRAYAYRYLEHRQVPDAAERGRAGRNCFEFRIENIGVVAAEGAAGWGPGINELIVEVIEVPEDDPEQTSALLRHVHQTSFDDASFDDPETIDLGELELSEISRQIKTKE